MLRAYINTVALTLLLIAPVTAELPFCLSDGIACDRVACDQMGCDGSPRGNFSGRAFLFAWAGNNACDLRLNYDEPLVTDRPDFTEASSTVGRGVTQFELGYTYVRNDDAGTEQHTAPELLIRKGLWKDWLELRVAYTGLTVADPIEDVSGSDDLYLGVKIGLTPQCGCLPESRRIMLRCVHCCAAYGCISCRGCMRKSRGFEDRDEKW